MGSVEQQLAQIAQRLDRLESIEAIRGIVTKYAITCDEHDLPGLMDLFTDDACFDAPNGAMVARGKPAIEEMFINTFKVRGPAFHWTHDVSVTIDPQNPNKATGLVLSHAETTPNGTVSIAAMRYADHYLRGADNIWRFAERVISFLYYVPAAEYSQGLNQTNRVHIGGQAIAADYPEKLGVWDEFIDQHGPLNLG